MDMIPFVINMIINPHMHKMGTRRPKHYIFGNQFYLKMAEGSDSVYSSILMLETYDIIILPEVDRIHKKL